MIFVVDAENRTYHSGDRPAMHRHGKATSIHRAGWKLPVIADQVIDGYGLFEGATYLLITDEPGSAYQ